MAFDLNLDICTINYFIIDIKGIQNQFKPVEKKGDYIHKSKKSRATRQKNSGRKWQRIEDDKNHETFFKNVDMYFNARPKKVV